nr:hypothetical protein [Nocardia brasiliensis]
MSDDADGIARMTALLREAEVLGPVGHDAMTSVGRIVLDLLHTRPAWRDPVPALVPVLTELLPPAQDTAQFQADLAAMVSGTRVRSSPNCSTPWASANPKVTRWCGGSASPPYGTPSTPGTTPNNSSTISRPWPGAVSCRSRSSI